MMTAAVQKDALGALWAKAAAALSGGLYGRPSPRYPGRTNTVHERNLSRHSRYKGVQDSTMAMGIVESILAALTGAVQTISCDGDALAGRVAVQSISSAHVYHFSPGRRAKRHASSWAAFQRTRPVARARPTTVRSSAWSCTGPWCRCAARAARPASCCSAGGACCAPWTPHLHAGRRTRPGRGTSSPPPARRPRTWPSATAGYMVPLDPRLFLRAPTAALPRPAHDPDADLDLAPDPDAQRAIAAADAAVKKGAAGLVETADTPRIRAAMEEDGAVFLVGPAGVGKTEWAQHLARELYDGFEKVRLTSRLHEEDLYGTPMQDADGRWVLQPGPLTRWAERVAAGKRLVLILDELPRAHGSIPDAIMAIVDTHSAADLAAEDRPIPLDPGPYHVVCVPGYNTFILPAARVKIVATGNMGESFRGLDLADPAFQDRWTWWLQLADFTPDEKRAILARHLGLPPKHTLITALIAVAKEVADYRETASRDLATSVTMRTLIRWGMAAPSRSWTSSGSRRPARSPAFAACWPAPAAGRTR